MVECGTCGFENDPGSGRCELCGSPLTEPQARAKEEYYHRVPTGVGVKQLPDPPSNQQNTDLGIGGVAMADRDRGSSQSEEWSERSRDWGTDVGERAATSAATRSTSANDTRDFNAISSRPGAISNLGQRAVEVAAAASLTGAHDAVPQDGENTAPKSLIGNVKLVVEQGLIVGEQYLLSEHEMTIGRADVQRKSYPDIDLSGQDNDYVHRVHARLQFHDLATHLSVEHLGGSNPTLVNNQPVERGELVEVNVGDRLRIGRVVMRLVRL